MKIASLPTAIRMFVSNRHPRIPVLLMCVAFAALCHPANAAPGDLDLTFGGTGKVITSIGSYGAMARGMAIQSNGKIVLAGRTHTGSTNDFAVVRFDANGSLDTTFNGTGKVTTDFEGNEDFGECVAVQSDGKIVVAGYSYNDINQGFAIVRYNANGSLDTSFNGTGKVTTEIGTRASEGSSVTVQSDGKIVVAGQSLNGTDWDFAVVRYNANGSLDTTFNGTGKVTTDIGGTMDFLGSVAVQNDEKIVIAGRSDGGFALVRYRPNGSLDTSFNGTGKVTTAIGNGHSMALQSDGKIVVAGTSSNGSDSDFALVRYNANGSLDNTFNSSGMVTTDFGATMDYGYSVAVQNDGKLVVAGASGTSRSHFALARYNGDGSLDTSFNGTGRVTTRITSTYSDLAYSVAVQNDGKIVAAGISDGSTGHDFGVVRYEAGPLVSPISRTVSLGSAVTFNVTATGPVPLSYQWQKDGVNISGATASSFTISNAQPWHVGYYTVVVTNSLGNVASSSSLLQINGVPTTLWQGLVIYYPFDGNALDRGPGASHALVSGASLSPDRLGQFNRAYVFDGINDQMMATVPSLPVGNAPRTLSLWAKAQADPLRSVGLVEWGLAQNGRAFGIGNRNSPYTWHGETFGGGLGVNSGALVDSKWHHVCLTYDGGTLFIYLDGVLRQTRAEVIDTGLSALLMGVGVGGTSFYPGSLDEVRIYNRALSAAEVQQLKASEDPDSDGDGILDRFETGTGLYVSPEDTGTSRTNADTDGDGLADGQEVNTYSSNPNVIDTDGDGFGDGFEVSTGFSPTSAASTPDAASTILQAVEYRFNGALGVSYRIETSTDLANWTTVETPIIGAGGVITRFYSVEIQPRRFFRSRRN